MIRSFKKRWFITLFLINILIIFPNPIFIQKAQPNLQIYAKCAVLMDALSGQALFEQNSRLKIAPASFVKLLTLYLAFDTLRAGHLKMEDRVTVSKKAWRIGGSKMFIKPGEKVKVEDLLKGIAMIRGSGLALIHISITYGKCYIARPDPNFHY